MFGMNVGRMGAIGRTALSLEAQIAAIFSSASGAWYDPREQGSLIQSAAGDSPVTAAGQSVGLELDKRLGLTPGAELVTNAGGPFLSAAGWSDQSGNAPVTASGGYLLATPTTTALSRTDTPIPVVAGTWYKLAVNVVQFSGAGTTLGILTSRNGPAVSGTGVTGALGVNTFYFRATTTGTYYLTFGSNISTAGVPNAISSATIKAILGTHAVQAASASRPKYQAGPARIVYDGIDDTLVTTFPSALGASCTVVRAVPGVGAAILTGQTIGTTFTDDQDHAGLIIINRPLTPAETAAVTQWANARSF